MFNNLTWRVVAQDVGHNVQSTANEHEVYRITKIYANLTNPSLPLVLVRADPVDSVNAASWYFLRGSYLNVKEFSEEFSFGNIKSTCQQLIKSYNVLWLDHKENQLELIAFAGRQLTETEKLSTLDPDLSLLSRKFQLLGVASVGLNISKETCSAISELRSANIGTVLISRKCYLHLNWVNILCIYLYTHQTDREPEEVVHLARIAGIILTKEPVAKIEIPSMEALPPSLSVIDLPETSKNDTYWLLRSTGCNLNSFYYNALLNRHRSREWRTCCCSTPCSCCFDRRDARCIDPVISRNGWSDHRSGNCFRRCQWTSNEPIPRKASRSQSQYS